MCVCAYVCIHTYIHTCTCVCVGVGECGYECVCVHIMCVHVSMFTTS